MTLDSTNDFYTELNLNPTKLNCDAICDGAMWDKDIDEYVDSCNAGLWEDDDHDWDGDDYDSYDYYYDGDHDDDHGDDHDSDDDDHHWDDHHEEIFDFWTTLMADDKVCCSFNSCIYQYISYSMTRTLTAKIWERPSNIFSFNHQ